MTPVPALDLCHVHKTYPGAVPVRALQDVSLRAAAGTLTLVAGPSGSGKTTLLALAGGLEPPSSGEVRIDGIDLARLDQRRLVTFRRERLGFVFQDFKLIEVLTAMENVTLALELRGWRRRAARDAARTALERVGLGEQAGRRPSYLSAGERQRVAIARALIAHPVLILADEPTANLDGESGHQVLALLQTAAGEDGATVLVVSHDPRVRPFADQVIHLLDGRLAAPGVDEEAA